ncbi:MAG: hypothetical protein WCB27_22055 [Thermoguttaceae bacterium]
MGLLSDTLEDNRERFGRTEMAEYVPIEPPPKLPPKVACPICDQVCGSEQAMRNHIAREHAQSHVYIKADDRIVRSTDVFPERPRRCQLILLGVDRVDVTVNAGPQSVRFSTDSAVNLSEHFPSDYTGAVHVGVQYGQVLKKFLIYFGTLPPFDQARLDAEVVQLQKSLERGIDPNWGAYQRRQEELSRNDLESSYLNGFFEYSLGFHMEKQSRWRESGAHLETAMHLLRPYITPLARTARRVLAIRMNCFAPLAHCHPTSVFYRAKTFFVDGLLELPVDAVPSQPSTDDCVYVDGFTDRLLVALKAYYAHDFTNVFEPLNSLADHPLAEDRNNEDKLLLLKARSARLRCDQKQACDAYERLRYHPMFDQEATEFLAKREKD